MQLRTTMKLDSNERTFALILCFVWMLGRGQTLPQQTSMNRECTEEDQKCVRVTLFKTLLVMCIFIGIGVVPFVLCCYCESQHRPDSAKMSMEMSEDSCCSRSSSQNIGHKSVIDELNQRLHVNGDDSVPGTVVISGRKLSKQIKPVISTQEKQHYDRLDTCDSQKERDIMTSSIDLDSLRDVETPELPQRTYLTDIEFVTQEYDLILCRPPEITEKCNSFSKDTRVYANYMTHLDTSNKSDKSGRKFLSTHRESISASVSMVALPTEYDLPMPKKGKSYHGMSKSPSSSALKPRTYRRQTPIASSKLSVLYDEVSPPTGYVYTSEKQLLRKTVSHNNMIQAQQSKEVTTIYQNIGAIQQQAPGHIHTETSEYQSLLLKHRNCNEDPCYMEVERSLLNNNYY